MGTRRLIHLLAGAAIIVAAAAALYWGIRFPPDTTPEGAYMRIAYAIARDDPTSCFAYLDEEAQHSAFTIADYARKATALIGTSYPEPARTRMLKRYRALAHSERGPGTWALLARNRGWIARLRRDLSGVASSEIVGERATVVTSRGTRYPFRRRPNSIWGLTLFTAEIGTEVERLARDWDQIQRASADYRRAARNRDEAAGGAPTDRH